MQLQLSITIDDLKAILVNLVNLPTRINVKTRNGQTNEHLQLKSFDSEFDIASFERSDEGKKIDISLYQIEAIDFDYFFSYRGESARTFSIE
jgi:hypothetical protein